jgi:magnesium transporter
VRLEGPGARQKSRIRIPIGGHRRAVLTILRDPGGIARNSSSPELPEDVIWIDLIDPTPEEQAFVESRAKIRVPSIEALSEIESSSRLATKDDVVYLSVPVVARGDTPEAFMSVIGFILTRGVLVTVRFAQLATVDKVTDRVRREPELRSAAAVFLALLEAMVDRGADVLEHLGAELAQVSKTVFRGGPSRPGRLAGANVALHRALIAVGTTGDRLALARDTLLGIRRIAPFVLSLRKSWIAEFEAKLDAVAKDIGSLNDYEGHLSNKVQFLLDAILGLITIQQNDVFKVLTIVSVVGIPPTLVAGIYGMNFKHMPELNWPYGYAYGLAVIALSALLPLAWFKWRGWF